MTIYVQIPFQFIIHNNPTTVCYTTSANEKVSLNNLIITLKSLFTVCPCLA